MKDDVLVSEYDSYTTSSNDYETERNKPMPNRIHGTIQSKLNFQLELNYGEQFDFPNEVSLDSKPGSTPDIAIFEKNILDRKTVQAREEEVPITTIAIISPSQSLPMMAKKAVDVYFPLGVKSAWIIQPPPAKSVYIFTPDGQHEAFTKGKIIDKVTGIEIELDKIFVGM